MNRPDCGRSGNAIASATCRTNHGLAVTPSRYSSPLAKEVKAGARRDTRTWTGSRRSRGPPMGVWSDDRRQEESRVSYRRGGILGNAEVTLRRRTRLRRL